MGHPPSNGRPFPVGPLGEFIARERERRSLTRAQVAALLRAAARAEGVRDCRVNDRAIERWEKGESIPRPDNLRWLARALGVPVERFTALAKQGKVPVQQEDNDTERRAFLGAMATASIGVLDPGLVAAALGAPSQADSRLLDDLEALTNEYGRMYWNMRPAVLWPTFYAHVAVTRRIHETAEPSLQPRAATIASQSASLLGMLAHRLDRRLDSIMLLNLADDLAAEAKDGPLRAHAMAALRAAY